MKKIFGWNGILVLAFMMVPMVSMPTPACATLSISPMIGYFEGRQRYIDINLINSGEKAEDYEISWKFMRMANETGIYENVDKSLTDFDLTKHLVYTPKKIRLRANEAQKIRLALRLDGEPPAPGDYRGHLELKQVTKKAPIPEAPTNIDGKKGLSVGIGLNIGFTIPVVYRVGESDASVKIGDVKTQINKTTGMIETVVDMTKSQSPFGFLGHLQIFYGDTIVGEIKNANIFAEVTRRIFTVPLTVKNLSGGSLRIVYKDYDEENKTIYDEKTVTIGQ